MRPDAPGWITAAHNGANVVAYFAPMLRTAYRLPQYRQPALHWDMLPTCDPAFAALMRQTWARLDLGDPAQFSPDEALLLRYYRMHGLAKLLRVARRDTPEDELAHYHIVSALRVLPAEALYALLSPEDKARWFPQHAFTLSLDTQGTMRLGCDSLGVTVARGQPCYFAHEAPPVSVRGVRLPVAFTRHALQRMQERHTLPEHRRFHTPLSYLFTFLAYQADYAVVELYGGHPAVVLFAPCDPPGWSVRYVEELVGSEAGDGPYRYRFGYCPITREGDFWIATTLLAPGFRGTPEYSRLVTASLQPGLKETLMAACEEATAAQLLVTQDFRMLKWFHTHGIPQVLPGLAQTEAA